jgi:hypothetical protein
MHVASFDASVTWRADHRHARESGHPADRHSWIPAFAGMTVFMQILPGPV